MPLITIQTEFAERARLRAERERERKARNRANWARDGRARHDGKTLRYSDYPFVMWDGEAPKDTGYSLFGSSTGEEICNPHLTTEQCFDLLLEAKANMPESIHVMFGSRYDFDEIIRASLPSDRLARIKWYGSVTWHGYTIKQAEGKWFSVKKDGVTIKVYEIFGWFHKSYLNALKDYQIGTKEEWAILESEKNRRAEFLWREIEDIRKYMRLELKLGPPLMERIRGICLQAGFNPRSWYGPSALATELMSRNKIKNHMAKTPKEVSRAAQFAFAAGRFEMVRGGILGPIYSADINNAYVWAMLDLPSLANGKWRKGRDFEPGKFGVYHIRYRHPKRFDPFTPKPLFRRLPNGTVTWPETVDNWYWSPEAELVADNPAAKFIEAWIFDEDSTERPFCFVKEVYRQRLVLKNLPKSNPSREAEMALKRALVAIFGQLCRTVGWDQFRKRAPAYHQLEWAGYLTSKCRAEIYKVALACGEHLISTDTDSVTATCPINVPVGQALGEWKLSEAEIGVFYQSGVYFLKQEGKWEYARLRGIDFQRKLPISHRLLITAIRRGVSVRIRPKARYVSIRQSLNWGLRLQGEWITPKDLETLSFGGLGKRYHNAVRCPELCTGDTHVFLPVGNLSLLDEFDPLQDFEKILYYSYPHTLPWKDEKKPESDVDTLRDWLWTDVENRDSDDYWKVEFT